MTELALKAPEERGVSTIEDAALDVGHTEEVELLVSWEGEEKDLKLLCELWEVSMIVVIFVEKEPLEVVATCVSPDSAAIEEPLLDV